MRLTGRNLCSPGRCSLGIYFAIQSYLANGRAESPTRMRAVSPAVRRVWTTAAWLTYFQTNVARNRPVPWEQGAAVTTAELRAIARSLQAWQLGETSDGSHLRAAALRYA